MQQLYEGYTNSCTPILKNLASRNTAVLLLDGGSTKTRYFKSRLASLTPLPPPVTPPRIHPHPGMSSSTTLFTLCVILLGTSTSLDAIDILQVSNHFFWCIDGSMCGPDIARTVLPASSWWILRLHTRHSAL
eukprot:3666508-Rhodomonas_salina.1